MQQREDEQALGFKVNYQHIHLYFFIFTITDYGNSQKNKQTLF